MLAGCLRRGFWGGGGVHMVQVSHILPLALNDTSKSMHPNN